jgi:hypothetical protein
MGRSSIVADGQDGTNPTPILLAIERDPGVVIPGDDPLGARSTPSLKMLLLGAPH